MTAVISIWVVSLALAATITTAAPAAAQIAGEPAATPAAAAEQQSPVAPEYPRPDWPMPVHDTRPHTFALADVFDFTPAGNGEASWDIEGWRGGDFNRIWFKSEGDHSLREADRNIDLQVMYGRFMKKFYDFQIGGGVQTVAVQGRSAVRGQAVVGVEGFVPYKFDLETLLFISHQGDVAGRVTFLREYLMTQRLILQPRVETNLAAQRVEEFLVGSGLNNIEFGVRLRYEIRRELGPYVGVAFNKSFFGTADLLRAVEKDPADVRLVFGLRAWQ